jgi:hypothetical protein
MRYSQGGYQKFTSVPHDHFIPIRFDDIGHKRQKPTCAVRHIAWPPSIQTISGINAVDNAFVNGVDKRFSRFKILRSFLESPRQDPPYPEQYHPKSFQKHCFQV